METSKYHATSVHFPDLDDAKLVKRAAKKAGLSVSAYLVQLATREAKKALGKCPACGRARAVA